MIDHKLRCDGCGDPVLFDSGTFYNESGGRHTCRTRYTCRACDGTGQSRYREYADCDVCDGMGWSLKGGKP